jgi:hypothetical protein
MGAAIPLAIYLARQSSTSGVSIIHLDADHGEEALGHCSIVIGREPRLSASPRLGREARLSASPRFSGESTQGVPVAHGRAAAESRVLRAKLALT